MATYFPTESTDSEGVPLKLLVFVGVIAVLGTAFFFIALAIDRKPIDPSINPEDPTAFEQTDASEQETPDLWVQKRPPPPDTPFTSTPTISNPITKPKDLQPLFPAQATSKPS